MDSRSRHPGRQVVSASILVAGLAAYVGLVSAQFFAWELSHTLRPENLNWAIRLDPFNAEYYALLGIFNFRGRAAPSEALESLKRATALNPNRSNYWLDRAAAEQLTGDISAENRSLSRAEAVNPHAASLAWELGNLYVSQGATADAFREYRRVMQNDPHLAPQAVQVCWRLRADTDFLLGNVIPPTAYKPFLAFLLSSNQPQAASQVWEHIVSSGQPVERQFLFDYLRHLFASHDYTRAARVWQQSAPAAGLAAYQPTEENLLVNADFALPVLNAGFDWTYQRIAGVALALDPVEGHSGVRSLRITFEGGGIGDAGIYQIISVEPLTQYAFSGYYKAQEMDGAGGVRIALRDPETNVSLFATDDLLNSDDWRQIDGVFSTSADAHAIALRIARVPAGSPIRGKLWLDDLKLVAADHMASSTPAFVPKKEQP
jgi:tetratricopeptide (TPR) repeat protein